MYFALYLQQSACAHITGVFYSHTQYDACIMYLHTHILRLFLFFASSYGAMCKEPLSVLGCVSMRIAPCDSVFTRACTKSSVRVYIHTIITVYTHKRNTKICSSTSWMYIPSVLARDLHFKLCTCIHTYMCMRTHQGCIHVLACTLCAYVTMICYVHLFFVLVLPMHT